TPGSFTNKNIQGVNEPLLIIVSDSYADKQTVEEAAYVNTPCVAFVNSDNSFKNVDIVIPMNNRSPSSIALGFYLLARAIKFLKGEESFDRSVKEDLEFYMFRDPAEIKAMENADETIATENITSSTALESESTVGEAKGGWF
ncbi:ribosomal protein S2, partial [Anncaliia algerae PRA109]